MQTLLIAGNAKLIKDNDKYVIQFTCDQLQSANAIFRLIRHILREAKMEPDAVSASDSRFELKAAHDRDATLWVI